MPVTVPQGVERWAVGRLKAYDRNARTHSPEQVAQIVASIREFGFTNPLLVAPDGEVIAGHGRLMAAQELGLGEVPVIVLGHLTPEQRRAYVIADNQLALNAGWDEELLRAELSDLEGLGFDLSLVGFSDEELSELMPEVEQLAPEDVDPDEAPEPPPEPVTKPGDLWILGKHRLLCGDSTNLQQIERLMDGQKADMVFTDPPYGMNLDTDYSKMGTSTKSYKPVHDDDKPFDAGAMMRLLPSPIWYIWGADYFCNSIPIWDQGSTLVWAKAHSEDENKVYGSSFELCWRYPKAKKELWFVRRIHMTDEHLKAHPTQKPCELPVRAIEKDSKPGQLIVDLFGGSGTTLIACEKTSRHCCMMELDPAYCDVIVKRWQQFTGMTATLEATGQPFPDADE